jgi:signal transduction histidine kinase
VEDTYAVAIAPVMVGDMALVDGTAALIAAAREAMVNAAKHAEVDTISVYAEFEASQASIFVRDRGRGFDPAAIAGDRRGVAESIRGRMERYGGRAELKSSPGGGTEWSLRMTLA